MLDLNQFANSHDSLEIVIHSHLSCVRKTFRSDILRAQRNVEKQRAFQPLLTGRTRISAADVLEFKAYSDRAELLMPYVEGMTGHLFPVHATRSTAHTLSISLSTLLYFELNASREERVPISLFREKLTAVSINTSDTELKYQLDNCLRLVNKLPDELLFPIGPCHGDLTLSNVIFEVTSGVTLIDFLETYLETPLQDVAKLKQDFVYGWSFRKDSSSSSIKAEILCRYHYPQAMVHIERMYPVQIQLLTLMALARIAPYVKDTITKQWVINSLNKCIGEFP